MTREEVNSTQSARLGPFGDLGAQNSPTMGEQQTAKNPLTMCLKIPVGQSRLRRYLSTSNCCTITWSSVKTAESVQEPPRSECYFWRDYLHSDKRKKRESLRSAEVHLRRPKMPLALSTHQLGVLFFFREEEHSFGNFALITGRGRRNGDFSHSVYLALISKHII